MIRVKNLRLVDVRGYEFEMTPLPLDPVKDSATRTEDRSALIEAFEIEAQGVNLQALPFGRQRFETICELIAGAQHGIDLVFYIFEADTTGTRLRDCLIQAANRGVAVRVIVDGFGTRADDNFFAPLTRAGAQFTRFSARWSRRYLIRNHQKLIVVDRDRAVVGGFNISDEYFCDEPERGWCDFGMRIKGGAVTQLADWFDSLDRWASSPRAQWFALRRMVRDWKPVAGGPQVLIGGPVTSFSSWHRQIRDDLGRAGRLDMMMAYFSPGAGMLRRIARIAERGEAQLVLAGKSDNSTTIGAARSLYHYLLRNQVAIWEFGRKKLHTKLIVIDDITYIGSANFDMRSLYINLELMLRIKDARLADKMRGFIAAHRSKSVRITPELHRRRAGLLSQLRWKISWLFVAVIDFTVTRRLNI